MKKILSNIGKLIAFILLLLVFWFLSYAAFVLLYSLFAFGDIPSRIDPYVARSAGGAAGCFIISISFWLIVMLWSKQRRFIKRFLFFIILYIPLLLCFALIANYILGSNITGVIFIPSVYLYHRLLNRQQTTKS